MRQIIRVTGAVQGVGYRPFVLRKATEYRIRGYVKNLGASVEIFTDGDEADVLSFAAMLEKEAPTGAIVLKVDSEKIGDESIYGEYDNSSHVAASNSFDGFSIIESDEISLSDELPIFLPDIGICDECMEEMLCSSDRRYRYPLISCAGCGPRISILNKLPYDRDTTTMEPFKMCPKCSAEYKNGRRTHAQTISCHDCGPQYKLVTFEDIKNDLRNNNDLHENIGIKPEIEKNNAIIDNVADIAIELLKSSKVLGLKGVSGYQIIGMPNNEVAIKIRQLKGRENKPFAVMFSNIDEVKKYCKVSTTEEELLKSSARPIVLLKKIKDFPYEVCKDSRYIGAFLPSAGIHRLLCDGAGPLIVTSANISDEPIIIDDDVFIKRFGRTYLDESSNEELKDCMIDAVLYHDRKINIPQDDSVVFVTGLSNGTDHVSFNRRSRGYAPLPLLLNDSFEQSGAVLAIGGDLKNTFSFAKKSRVITSPYIGDLKDFETAQNSKKLLNEFERIFDFAPEKVVCDLHPNYESRVLAQKIAEKQNIPLLEVQHHHAHILSVMAEKGLKSCIGIAFDGTGYGTDGKIWGGEVLYCQNYEYDRLGHLSYVKLCGGDIAPKKADQVRECYEYALEQDSISVNPIVKAALFNNIGTYETSSVGRLFDAVSSLLDIKHENSFEGECAIALEKAAWEFASRVSDSNESIDTNDEISQEFIDSDSAAFKDFEIDLIKDNGSYIIDQIGLFKQIKDAKEQNIYTKEELAFIFHASLTDAIVRICDIVRGEKGENRVCLSGGVFGNRLLLKLTYERLSAAGFLVYTNEYVPAGDAGISVGQAYFGLLKDNKG